MSGAEEKREETAPPAEKAGSKQGSRVRMPDAPDVSDSRKVNALLAKYSTLILILLYILLGVVFYTHEEDWSVLNSMFFIMFTLTTVGYGCPDCPTSQRSRAFTAFYALAGIGLIASIVLGAIEKGMKDAEEMVDLEQHDAIAETGGTLEGKEEKPASKAQKKKQQKLVKMLMTMGGLVLHLAIVTFGFKALEDVTTTDGFYSAGQTLTTVGYGDISPSEDSTKLFACFYMPTLVVHFGLCVEAVTSYILMLKASDKDILKEPESAADKAKSGMGMREILKKLDKDPQGRITKLSFLRYMATKKLGIAPSVFYKINARFKDLDVDKSGSLDKMDVLRFGVKMGGA